MSIFWSLPALVLYPQPHPWTLDSENDKTLNKNACCHGSKECMGVKEIYRINKTDQYPLLFTNHSQWCFLMIHDHTSTRLTLRAHVVGSRPFQTPSSCDKWVPDPRFLNKSPKKSREERAQLWRRARSLSRSNLSQSIGFYVILENVLHISTITYEFWWGHPIWLHPEAPPPAFSFHSASWMTECNRLHTRPWAASGRHRFVGARFNQGMFWLNLGLKHLHDSNFLRF